MFGDSTYQYITDDLIDDDEEQDTSDYAETLRSQFKSERIHESQQESSPSIPLEIEEPIANSPFKSTKRKDSETNAIRKEQSPRPHATPLKHREEDIIVKSETNSKLKPQSSTQRKTRSQTTDLGPRRSKRSAGPVERLTYTHDKSSFIKDTTSLNLLIEEMFDETIHSHYSTPDHYVFVSSKEANPDLFSYDQAMNGEHRHEWIKAAKKEVTALEKLDCWEEVPFESATTKVIPGTWVFKVKRAPDGTFKKFKARYCIRGDLQEGEFETYAPVVQYSSVRLFLAWSLMLNWYTCCIDFSNTFIHPPRGFRTKSKQKSCLRLKKSIYGLSVAPRLWHQHLWKALEKLGLKQSKHDHCLLLRKDLIVICYVDDLGIQAPTQLIVDELIKQLPDAGFDLTHEGSFSEYLGIKYNKLDGNVIKMTQERLIQKIIDTTGMKECSPNKTPSTREALGSDETGAPMEDSWNYRSVIGMLLYLSTNTRPDIAYAVSQAARFSHNPKKSHASAVKTIIRYLSGSKDQGVIYKRPKNLRLDCYVDADFAGLYGREPPENPISVKSRTGYIMSVGGCYILCKSQLQSTIALSTSEAEYGALSQAMRALIPIRETLLEMIKTVEMVDAQMKRPFGDKETLCSFPTVVHEDNTSALNLAVNQKVTSRTKHWCIKFHFFWSYVNDTTKNTTVVQVDTKEQRADYLTKGLVVLLFVNCRKLNQGW